jgi:hypothetical protein
LRLLRRLGAVTLAACGRSSNSGTSANGPAAAAEPDGHEHRRAGPLRDGRCGRGAIQATNQCERRAPAGNATTSSAAANANAHPNSPPVGGVNVPTNAGTGTPPKKPRHPAQRFGPKVQNAYIEFSRCMRAHGVNLPEPNFSGGPVYAKKHVDTNGPGFAAAANICRAQIIAAASR